MDHTLKVYVKPGCPWCADVLAHLRAEGYEFHLVDVIADRTAFNEMRLLSGQDKAPTVTIRDLVLADCGVPELREFLLQHDIQP